MTPIDDKITEKAVVRSLMKQRFPKHICLPNYTPAGWWENDLLTITPAGYWWEFEVKLSLPDFRHDVHKEQMARGTTYVFGGKRPMEKKHDLLAAADRGPARFWYVTPVGLVPHELLPAWAGLIEVTPSGKLFYERVIVEAPVRHKIKVEPEFRRAIFETCYWRMHRMLP